MWGISLEDPDLRYVPGGMAVCEFSLAVQQSYRLHGEPRDETCYVDIVASGRHGENSKEHLHKGSRVLVEGRLTQRRWETAEGKRRSKYEIVASVVGPRRRLHRGPAAKSETPRGSDLKQDSEDH